MQRIAILWFFPILVSCSKSTMSNEAPLSDATELACPTPGPLPFRLESTGFRSASNASAADGGFAKDEASDAVGTPGLASANVFLDQDAAAPAGIASYQGLKARSTTTTGLTPTAIAGEYVSLWYYDAAATDWVVLGRTTTDAQGGYVVPATKAPSLGAAVYAVLEADGTCAAHYDDLLPAGSNVVVADIDGTLTTDDGQLITEAFDETYVPAMMKDANVMLQRWAKKGYPIVYLTARSHLFRAETRLWLTKLSFPVGIVITAPQLVTGAGAESYKATWLARMVTDFGWSVVAAYGNADTDIEAYQSVAIPNEHIFIVGPRATNSSSPVGFAPISVASLRCSSSNT